MDARFAGTSNVHKHGIKSCTHIESDAPFAQREILAFAFHSDSISARDNLRAGSASAANSINFVPPCCQRLCGGCRAALPYLLCSHDNTLQSSSCELPPDCLIAPDSVPSLRLSTQTRLLPLIIKKPFPRKKNLFEIVVF